MDAVLSKKMTEAASSMSTSIIENYNSGKTSVTTVDVVNLLFATSMVSANHMTNVRTDINEGDTRFSTTSSTSATTSASENSSTTTTNADGSTTTTTASTATTTTTTTETAATW